MSEHNGNRSEHMLINSKTELKAMWPKHAAMTSG